MLLRCRRRLRLRLVGGRPKAAHEGGRRHLVLLFPDHQRTPIKRFSLLCVGLMGMEKEKETRGEEGEESRWQELEDRNSPASSVGPFLLQKHLGGEACNYWTNPSPAVASADRSPGKNETARDGKAGKGFVRPFEVYTWGGKRAERSHAQPAAVGRPKGGK